MKPEIYHYTDYRLFLKQVIEYIKVSNPNFSQRFIMQKVGVKSSGWLADILSGRKNISLTRLLKLSALLGLSAREELYLETLMNYNQAPTMEEKNRAYEKLLTFHEIPKDIIGRDRFEYFSKWYYSAIRELLLIRPFKGDYHNLAKALEPQISPAQARKAIQLLEKLGFIKKYVHGEYRPSVEHVKKQNAFSFLHYYQYIKSNMELGVESLERFSKEERDTSALALTLSLESFQRAKEEIKQLRNRLVMMSETDNKKFWNSIQSDSRRVYQCTFQIFPMSKNDGAQK